MLKVENINPEKLQCLRLAITRYSQLNRHSDCWLWLRSKNKDGYGGLRVNSRTELAHRVAYTIFIGNIPEGMRVIHRCNAPSCVNPEHLCLDAKEQDLEDMPNNSRKPSKRHVGGFRKGHTLSRASRVVKLTDDDVRSIRTLDCKLASIAEKYDIPISYVCSIRKGKRKTLVNA